ncbi:hypothetical protein ACFSM5_19070 [Lacibacterium aquatile]|uniref:Uncharacterized protein n=1 Tax=Lacibacterium aquatile TaxID=1168082 RepID=A0ABW5DX24_9PROT
MADGDFGLVELARDLPAVPMPADLSARRIELFGASAKSARFKEIAGGMLKLRRVMLNLGNAGRS